MSNKVVELFAGVGGFHLAAKKSGWEVIWANEWFPDTIVQHAYDCYNKHFPNICVNEDIAKVIDEIPSHDLLVGGFPCQDYSVAASGRKGIQGKKGVLWWELAKVIHAKKPKYILLENVDRLLKSPVAQRGRDFAIMLATLDNLGYSVEWRVINSGDYGFPQRRRRVFIFAWNSRTKWNSKFRLTKDLKTWLIKKSLFSKVFPSSFESQDFTELLIPNDPRKSLKKIVEPVNSERLLKITNEWPKTKPDDDNFIINPFRKSGLMSKGKVITSNYKSTYKGRKKKLKDVLEKGDVDELYYLDKEQLGPLKTPPKGTWRYEKGAKKLPRKDKVTGFEYFRTEGAVPFPDSVDKSSRTIITGEGGPSPARHKHVIEDSKNNFRRLTPVEVERLNGFRKNWTNTGMPENKRYYCMGNSLVVGLVAKILAGIKDS